MPRTITWWALKRHKSDQTSFLEGAGPDGAARHAVAHRRRDLGADPAHRDPPERLDRRDGAPDARIDRPGAGPHRRADRARACWAASSRTRPTSRSAGSMALLMTLRRRPGADRAAARRRPRAAPVSLVSRAGAALVPAGVARAAPAGRSRLTSSGQEFKARRQTRGHGTRGSRTDPGEIPARAVDGDRAPRKPCGAGLATSASRRPSRPRAWSGPLRLDRRDRAGGLRLGHDGARRREGQGRAVGARQRAPRARALASRDLLDHLGASSLQRG